MPVTNIDNVAHHQAGNLNNPGGFKLYKVDDDTLRDWAWQKSRKDINQVAKNAAKVVLVGVPVADTFLSAVSQNGSLSTKLAKGAKNAGRWGAALGAGVVLAGLKSSLWNKSEKAEGFDRKHPLIALAVDLAVISGLYIGALVTGKKVSNLMKNGSFAKSKEIVKNALNNSKLNKNIVKPFDDFLKNHPYTNDALKFTAGAAAPIMLVSAYLRYRKEAIAAVESANINYQNLRAINNRLPEKPVDEVVEEA